MRKIVFLAYLVLLLAASLSADIYIKQVTKTDAFMGQPAKEIIQEQWFGDNKVATVTQENTIVIDMKENKFYMINHKTKTYISSTLPLDMAKLMPDQMAGMMQAMMDGMTISVSANGQTRKIQNWNAKGYDVKMNMMGMDMKMVFWASTEVPFDWRKLTVLSEELYKAQMRLGDKFIAEFKKIEGYPIATNVDMMGMKVDMSTVEISQKTAPAGVFAPPAGYVKKDKFSMEEMQQR